METTGSYEHYRDDPCADPDISCTALTNDVEIMVIGGGEVYAEALAFADRLYITHVEASPPGDVVFPSIDSAVWRAVSADRLPAGPRDSAPTTFVIYERIAGAKDG